MNNNDKHESIVLSDTIDEDWRGITIARIDDKKYPSQTNIPQREAPNWEYGFNQGTKRRQRRRKRRDRINNFIVEMNDDALEKGKHRGSEFVAQGEWPLNELTKDTATTESSQKELKSMRDDVGVRGYRRSGVTLMTIQQTDRRRDDVMLPPNEEKCNMIGSESKKDTNNYPSMDDISTEMSGLAVNVDDNNCKVAMHCDVARAAKYATNTDTAVNSVDCLKNASSSVPRPHPTKRGPIVLSEYAFDMFVIEFNTVKYVQNGILEVSFEKHNSKDYIHVVLFECVGGGKTERVSRHGFKICASSVLPADSNEDMLKNALLDTARQLEKVSKDSFLSIGKPLYEVSECSLSYLAKRCITPLKNRSARFTRSIYYCNLCHFHINSVDHAIMHFEGREHVEAEKRRASLSRLQALPGPGEAHLESIGEVLKETMEEIRLPSNAYEDCELLIRSMNELLYNRVHPDCSVQLFGSYLARNASQHSNINLLLTYPESFTQGQILSVVAQILEGSSLACWIVSEVITDQQRSSPTVCVSLKRNGVAEVKSVAISVQSLLHFKSSQLIALYGRIRSQFVELSLLFRYWAKTCSLDVISLGGLPKIAFDVMLIHFLQTKQLLPYLFKIIPKSVMRSEDEYIEIEYENDEQEIIKEIGADKKDWDLPKLWVELFRYYVLEHSTESLVQIRFNGICDKNISSSDNGHWNKKRIAIEDPFALDRIMQPSQYIVDFFSNCFLATFLYFTIPCTTNGPLIPYKLHIAETSSTHSKKTRGKSDAKGVATNAAHTRTEDGTGTEVGSEQAVGEIPDTVVVADSDCLTSINGVSEAEWEEIKNDHTYENTDSGENCDVERDSRKQSISAERSDNDQLFPVENLMYTTEADEAGSSDLEARLSFSSDSLENCEEEEFEGGSDALPIKMSTEVESVDVTRNTEFEDTEDRKESLPVVPDADVFGTDPADSPQYYYNRHVMFELSRKADTNFVSQKELEGLGISHGDSNVNNRRMEIAIAADTQIRDSKKNSARRRENKRAKKSPTSKNVDESSFEFTLELPELNMEMLEEELTSLRKEDFAFEWDEKALTGDMKPQMRCVCCGRSGHLIDNCPDLEVPPAIPLKPLSSMQKEFLGDIIISVYENLRMTVHYENAMRELCRNVERRLRADYRNDCRLSLFGSASNGFGLIGSDADICLRFASDTLDEDVDTNEVIMRVATVVRSMPGIANVIPIPNAKVPIVKFHCQHRYNRLEADVSLYNVLALENTRLLHAYSELDERAKELGVVVKEWAKCCGIGDASRGTLSSYSFIVMLIHFLQRTTPPVLPFLQEMEGRGRRREPKIVEDCDVYFCSVEDSEWMTENTVSVSELWIGFLDYYSRIFDFGAEVVQIRRSERLSKLDKGWQGRPIAIEDPFDLKHNLSSGVHMRTMAYIQRSFIRSRERFARIRCPTKQLNNNRFEALIADLFGGCRVGAGPPLARNCCYRCRQIGHFVENCPLGQKGGRRTHGGTPAKEARRARDVNAPNRGNENRERIQQVEPISKIGADPAGDPPRVSRGSCTQRRGRARHVGQPVGRHDGGDSRPPITDMRPRGRGRGHLTRTNSQSGHSTINRNDNNGIRRAVKEYRKAVNMTS
uniref:RNA uridylyltransferase n=3 Tax=Parascaris univalens TaxID=6257 RepID=A0A915BT66_PARUN